MFAFSTQHYATHIRTEVEVFCRGSNSHLALLNFFLCKFVDYDHSSGKSKDIDWLGPKGLDLQGIKARGNLVLVFFNY